MEENEDILQSYYEISYLDDNNEKHLRRIKNVEELNFIKNRFEVKDVYFVNI